MLVKENRAIAPLYTRLVKVYNDYRFRAKLWADLRQQDAILTHQMGKVGSSSLLSTLEALGLNLPIYHTHFLNHERLDNHLSQLRSKNRAINRHLIVSQYLRKQLDKGLDKKNWKVITLVREPIVRNISAFFQNIESYFPDFSQRYDSGTLSVEEVIETFLNSYPHDLPLHWLDLEIEAVFGIDVFSRDFPKSRGYGIFKNGSIDLLLIRLESLASCYREALREFLGVRTSCLASANVATDKGYYNAYRELKDAIVFPHEYVERMYMSKYAKHFYSEEEIDSFRARWSS